MLLRPRKFLHKNIQTRRHFKMFKKSNLTYGNVGLILLQPIKLNSKHIYRYKLFLKKATKRSDKTLRKAWFNIFPHLPITTKVEGARMGKGKGKLDGWFTELSAGTILMELKNLRFGRGVFFLKQVQFKTGSLTRIITKTAKKTPAILSNKIYVNVWSFW